jgi:hypothetical protein
VFLIELGQSSLLFGCSKCTDDAIRQESKLKGIDIPHWSVTHFSYASLSWCLY